MDDDYLQSTRAVVAALKTLQEKVQCLERERNRSVQEVDSLESELARRRESFEHTQQLLTFTALEQAAADRLSYERLLAEKRANDLQLKETEEVVRDLKGACEHARGCSQNAEISQLAAEAKLSVLERRLEEGEKKVRAKNNTCLQVWKDIRRQDAVADAQLESLSVQIERLERNLRVDRSSREATERNCRQVQEASARTRRYLKDILRVNQELVMRKTETFEQPCSTAKRTTSVSRKGRGQPSKPRPTSAPKKCPVGRPEPGTFEEVRLSTAVADALRAGRAGGDAVSLLEGLYERIGFSVLKKEEEENGFRTLPTSPNREKVRDIPEAASYRDEEEDFYSVVTPPPLNSRRHEYSFAHLPTRRPVSIAERSPKLLRRLEGLASELNREKAEVQRRYKTIVQRACPSAHSGETGADLDSNWDLMRAIASLQGKAQQFQVVQECLRALKAVSQPNVYSPKSRRQKLAALHVLDRLRQDRRSKEKATLTAA